MSDQENNNRVSETDSNKQIEKDPNLYKIIENILLKTHSEGVKSRRWNNGFKLFFVAYLSFILFAVIGGGSLSTGAGDFGDDHIAIVHIDGQIAYGTEWDARTIISGLSEAFDAPNSKAVILSINSPGGSPVQSDQIFQYIMNKKQETQKPVYAVIQDLGASGAYYIAAAADEIHSNPMSLVGSIGVVSGGFGFTGVMEKMGVERRLYTSGKSKAMLDPFSKQSDDQIAKWQEVLKITHDEFIASVKAGRGDRLNGDADLFSGRVWSGRQALDLGLVDGFNSITSLSLAKFDMKEFKDYTNKPKSIGSLFKKMGVSASEGVLQGMSAQMNNKLN